MARSELCRLRTRVRRGGTLIRKTSLLHKIEPTAMRSSVAGIRYQLPGIGRQDESCFPIPALLIPESDRSPLHDVRHHARFAKAKERADQGYRERALHSRCKSAAPPGGARRDRTDDLLLAKQALSQLSYGPFRDQASAIKDQDHQRILIRKIPIPDTWSWWAWEDLNFRPHAYQARALTN
jgi:hypothetical protein